MKKRILSFLFSAYLLALPCLHAASGGVQGGREIQVLLIENFWVVTGVDIGIPQTGNNHNVTIDIDPAENLTAQIDHIRYFASQGAAPGDIAALLAAKDYDVVFYMAFNQTKSANIVAPSEADYDALKAHYEQHPWMIVDGTALTFISFTNFSDPYPLPYFKNVIRELDKQGGGIWIGGNGVLQGDADSELQGLFLNNTLERLGFSEIGIPTAGGLQNPAPTHGLYEDLAFLAGKPVNSGVGVTPVTTDPQQPEPNGSVLFPLLSMSSGLPVVSANFIPDECINKLLIESERTIYAPGERFNVTLDLDLFEPPVPSAGLPNPPQIDAALYALYTLQAEVAFDPASLQLVGSQYTPYTDAQAYFNDAMRFDMPMNTDNSAGLWQGTVSFFDEGPGMPFVPTQTNGRFATLTFEVGNLMTPGTLTIGADNGHSLFLRRPDASTPQTLQGLCLPATCVVPLEITLDIGDETLTGTLTKPLNECAPDPVPPTESLAGVEVTLRSLSTQTVRTAITNGNGEFTFDKITMSDYQLHAQGGFYLLPGQVVTVTAGVNDVGSQEACAGDLDGNGQIELADKGMLEAQFDTSTAFADLNDDGIVDIRDFAMYGANVGKGI